MKSSRKGSSFERKICKDLSLWVTDNNLEDVFYRTAGSGGRGTFRAKQGKETANAHGDMMYTRPEGEMFLRAVTVEMKKGYNAAIIEQLFNGESMTKSETCQRRCVRSD